jgi:DNA-binding MarR family transcriptional regulator
VSSNISAAGSPDQAGATRATLVAEVVQELTSWDPREWTRALRHWHRGAISLVHLDVLMALEEAGPLSMGHLAEYLDVSVASATGIVSRMVNRGLVVRRHDESDRRVVVVDRSPAGEQIFRDIGTRRRAGLTRLLEGLTDDELSALLTGHRALRAARSIYVAQQIASGAQPATTADHPQESRTDNGHAR